MHSLDSQPRRARTSSSRWEHFPHDADIGVRGFAESPASAFEQGAVALSAVISDPACIEPRDAVSIKCETPDLELLFVEWLNTLIFEMATRRMIFARFAVSIEGNHLSGTAWGEPIDIERHQPATEVKGATYTQLHVRQATDGCWIAGCVVDV